jgi:hypothetical protein
VDDKMALGHSIPDPVKTHVNSFGTALFDCAISNAGSTGIIGLNGGRGLRVAKIVEGSAESGGFLAIVKEGTKFGFGSGGDNNF